MIQDIPKLYTALAEWLACVLFVRLLPQRYNAAKTAGILAAALPLFGLVQWLIGIVPLSLWIPGMIVALVLMYATIWLCCRLNFCDTGFWWALAFTLAEFVASLEWQLYSFGASKMPGSWWIQGLFLLAFYGGGFGVFLRLEQKRLRDKAPLHMTRRESISAAVIAICTFLISNISYVTTNTPFSGRMTTEIFWIRTLVDFAGVAVLLSMQDRWQDMQTQHELTAIQTLLKRQYEQYRISRDNSEAINRKYHDLKHQIQVIRMESDAARREEYLSQLEKGMQSLGVNQHTGNDVLDTILSDKQLYCSQHQITLTIVADGARLDFIETMDICSIFGNALDNAIEGVEKLADPQQRLIRVAVYAPAMNIHRSAFGGRNFEYYSECGVLSGLTAAAEVSGATENGLICYVKHFAFNDQDNYRQNNICTWLNEQSAREIYLKAFEQPIKAGGMGVMTSMNAVGPVWAGGCKALLTNILRDEWGFHGAVITDAVVSAWYMDGNLAIRTGGTKMLAFNITNEFYRDLNSVGTVTAMRNAAHGTLYALANSFAVTRAVAVPKWVKTTYAVDAVVAIILVAWEICAIRKYRKAKKEDEDTEQ